ncbi:hypothetical protein SETIT_7G060500v2 [Setaria italica]|uniref:F-box domain-containing protein n=2 Tax=Setaria italica TaxID=4555 RepID=A0A368RSV0_SETIT|nr:F-box protein At2g02240 [Setaria italica]RCV33163.1 hypothetical protein SETIT_7G060500v2 [Setaria italica]
MIMKRSRRVHEKKDGEDDENTVVCNILRLPEACLAHAISLTTPGDACRSIAVSSAFQAAASSNSVWERFLPPGYGSILARADHPVDLTSTMKELFCSLAQDHVLLDQGTKSFWLEQTSGAKCYMLSSSSLGIAWRENPLYWRRTYLPDSRFEEVTELLAVCWLEVSGKIDSGELSPDKKYSAYLVFRLLNESCGLDCPTQQGFITRDGEIVSAKRIISLHPQTTAQEAAAESGDEQGRGRADEEVSITTVSVSYPRERDDGWMEVELGEFYNRQEDTGILAISLIEHVQLHWKKGLICEGIEIRPKK